MVITNYSFFSPILDEKTFSPSRVYTSDGTTIPIKENKYKTKYKKLIINLIKKNKISVVYIIAPLDSTNIYNYIDHLNSLRPKYLHIYPQLVSQPYRLDFVFLLEYFFQFPVHLI